MVVDEDGPRCQGNCPNRGCLEAVASGTAIGREGKIAAEQEPDSELGAAAADGERDHRASSSPTLALGGRRGLAHGARPRSAASSASGLVEHRRTSSIPR